ncbi:hypothetical protein [Halomonas sp. MMSF_3323]|uniref:hypothetical protein n=1 Tax=Halomonas sp. MMSF_3323 TaxID=3046701 RepID=UPI00273E25B6|nr:hypothetical protein [Halomonas sp. MMSF_3323]
MKSTSCIAFAFLLMVFTSCATAVENESREERFSLVATDITQRSNDELVIYEVAGTSFPISIVFFKESERSLLIVNDDKWRTVAMDGRVEPAMESTYLFKKDQSHVLMFPTFTEEFPTFQLIQFEDDGNFVDLGMHTYSFDDFVKKQDEIRNGSYRIQEFDESIRVVLENGQNLLLSEVWFDKIPVEPVSGEERKMYEAFTPGEKNTDRHVVQSYSFDINRDGVEDKINVYRNDEYSDTYERDYFGLAIEVFKGGEDGLISWLINENMVFPAHNTCVAEGFDRIFQNDRNIVITQYTCTDYTVVVSSVMTFTIEDNELYLTEYRESYFDKANHNAEIPTCTWSQSDFGKVRFEEVSVDFINALRCE